MKKIKIIALALSALLCVSAFTGCFSKDEKNNESNNVQNPASNIAATADLGLSQYNWKYDDDEVMFNVGDDAVDFAEYRYYLMTIKSSFDGGDPTYWNDETEAEFSDYIIDEIKLMSALRSYCTKNNIVLSQKDKQEIADMNYDSFGMTQQQYTDWLENVYITQELFDRTLVDQYLVQNLYKSCTSDEEIKEYAEKNYVRVSHILVSTLDENGLPLDGDALEEKTALANSLYNRAVAGEDFDALVKEYGEDPGMASAPKGYFFTTGKMVKEFEDKSFELEVGEIGEPVKTSYGYHIIKKLPLDVEAEIANETNEYWEIVYLLGGEEGYNIIAEYASTLPVEKTDALNDLKVSNIIVSKK